MQKIIRNYRSQFHKLKIIPSVPKNANKIFQNIEVVYKSVTIILYLKTRRESTRVDRYC